MRRNLGKGLAAGLIAGLGATYLMTRFQEKMMKLMGEEQSDESATTKAAEKISHGLLHRELTDSQKQKAGNTVHYIFGTAVGGAYGAATEFAPRIRTDLGLPFGSGLFLGADEIAVPAAGLSKPPQKVPVKVHAYGLASHLVYGLALESLRRGLRAAIA